MDKPVVYVAWTISFCTALISNYEWIFVCNNITSIMNIRLDWFKKIWLKAHINQKRYDIAQYSHAYMFRLWSKKKGSCILGLKLLFYQLLSVCVWGSWRSTIHKWKALACIKNTKVDSSSHYLISVLKVSNDLYFCFKGVYCVWRII